jgi:hypothetical protein
MNSRHLLMEMDSGSLTESATSNATSPPAESVNGLKFGKKIYFEDHVGVGAPAKSGTGSSSSGSGSGSSRKAQGGQHQQPPRCQVEGCKVDLSDAKTYYSRHKVCSMHSKSPRVIVAGLVQRFCQQCSRSVCLCFFLSMPLLYFFFFYSFCLLGVNFVSVGGAVFIFLPSYSHGTLLYPIIYVW